MPRLPTSSARWRHPTRGATTLFSWSGSNPFWYRDRSPLTFYRGRFFGLIPLPVGLWAAGAEVTAEAEETTGISLLDPWW